MCVWLNPLPTPQHMSDVWSRAGFHSEGSAWFPLWLGSLSSLLASNFFQAPRTEWQAGWQVNSVQQRFNGQTWFSALPVYCGFMTVSDAVIHNIKACDLKLWLMLAHKHCSLPCKSIKTGNASSRFVTLTFSTTWTVDLQPTDCFSDNYLCFFSWQFSFSLKIWSCNVQFSF